MCIDWGYVVGRSVLLGILVLSFVGMLVISQRTHNQGDQIAALERQLSAMSHWSDRRFGNCRDNAKVLRRRIDDLSVEVTVNRNYLRSLTLALARRFDAVRRLYHHWPKAHTVYYWPAGPEMPPPMSSIESEKR